MKLKLYSLFILLTTSLFSFCQYPDLAWGNFIGGTPVSYQNHIESDFDNNSYHMGFFSGTGEFGVTSGQVTHNSGSNGMVLTKRNPNGNTEWILPFNGVTVASFDIDSEGNIVLYMQHNGGNLNPIEGNNYSGGSHYVLAKYASNGSLLWYKKSPNSFGLYQSKCLIKLDQNDNIYVSGPFIFTKDFDFSLASNTLSSGPYYSDLFVAKYTDVGDFLWVKQIGASSASAHVVSIAVNNNGNVYVAGWYSDTIVVDPTGSSVQLVSTEEFGVNSESYLVGFGSTGNLLFANTFENSDPLDIVGMHADNINLYLFHNMYGVVNINPNPGTPIYSSTQGSVLRVSANTSTFYSNTAIADDAAFIFSGRYVDGGKYIFSGSYSGVTDFDPTSNVSSVGSAGGYGNFISEITTSFNYLGTSVFPSVNSQYTDVIRLKNNSLAYTGYNSSGFDIDYTIGTTTITSPISGTKDFLTYYSSQLPELNIVNESSHLINSGSNTPSLLNSTDFGDVCLNDSRTVTYSLVNTGLGDLTISNVSMTGTDASLYSHDGTSGVVPSGDTMYISVSITGTSIGIKNATLVVQNNDNDEGTYQFDISTTVRELPSVGNTLTPNSATFCYGDTVLLSGTGAETYVWNNGVINNVAFPITQSGFYLVTGTSIYGCESSAATILSVNPLPTVSVSSNDPDNSICLNDPIQLAGSGAQSYAYSNGVIDQTDFYPTVTQNYTVTGTDVNGCTNDTNITITVYSLPNVTVTSNDPNDAICLNESVQLIGSGANTYSYSNGVLDQTDFFPTSTQTYTVTGTDVNGCSNSTSLTITVNPLPAVSVTSNAVNDEICLNDPIQLIGAGAATYTYSNGVIDQTDFYPSSNNTYNMIGTDVNGCQDTASIAVTVNPLPNVSVVSS